MGSKNPSPLRYPGGKYKISKLIELLIGKAEVPCDTYVEPFAGGAGVALEMLLSGVVERIVINDGDCAISSIWKAMCNENDAFLEMLHNVEVTIDEWRRQRDIYFSSKKYSLEYGFSAFFLNRTNHSGILGSGPIGGQEQNGEWKLDVRFNKEDLEQKIKAIGELRSQISVYNKDVFCFLRTQVPRLGCRAFAYFDPPYYNKGKVLYQNFFTPEKHMELKSAICGSVAIPWIVSYDDVPEIREIYKDYPMRPYSLSYSLANNGRGREVMFFKSDSLMPTQEDLANIGMDEMFGGSL